MCCNISGIIPLFYGKSIIFDYWSIWNILLLGKCSTYYTFCSHLHLFSLLPKWILGNSSSFLAKRWKFLLQIGLNFTKFSGKYFINIYKYRKFLAIAFIVFLILNAQFFFHNNNKIYQNLWEDSGTSFWAPRVSIHAVANSNILIHTPNPNNNKCDML